MRTRSTSTHHSPRHTRRYRRHIRVLAIDGGGVRGIFPAAILASLERFTRQHLSRAFDLLVGTSAGGLLALALAAPDRHGSPRHTAQSLPDLFTAAAPRLFTPRHPASRRITILARGPRYRSAVALTVLKDLLGTTPLSRALLPVVVPAYDLSHATPILLGLPDQPDCSLADAARATSAAPTYFEPAPIAPGRFAADGGLACNNPASLALAIARRRDLFPRARRWTVVSLGTGSRPPTIPAPRAGRWGSLRWAPLIADLVIEASARAAWLNASMLAAADRAVHLVRIDPDPSRWRSLAGDFDDTTPARLRALRADALAHAASHHRDLRALAARLDAPLSARSRSLRPSERPHADR